MIVKTLTIRDWAEIALVAAIYVALTITPPLNTISFGAYQFRLSESLNFMAFYNKKYIWALTLGCMISNAYSFGAIDIVVGGLSTLVFVSLGVLFFQKYQSSYIFSGFLNRAFFYFSLFFAASMFTIALELHVVAGLPFFLTWFTTAMGELGSLLLGAVVMDKLGRRIDLRH